MTKPENPYSADWLRSFSGCEHYGDDECIAIINSLHAFSAILSSYSIEPPTIGTPFDILSETHYSHNSKAA